MRVKSLVINNLRNIVSSRIAPDPCLNCFTGDNGAGKTSILEALSVLSKGRSFRTGQTASLVGPEGSTFRVVATTESEAGEVHQLGMERGGDQWAGRHNGNDVRQLSELTRLLPHVLLEPGSHMLVSGPPEGRRKYLDWGVFHVEHEFLALWRRCNRVLKQRNAALRQSGAMVVESLDPQFVALGESLHQVRQRYAEKLKAIFEDRLASFNQVLGDVSLSYRKGWAGDSLAEALKQSHARDFERGATGPGPHKADLYLSLDGLSARERLSRGEQKALAAAMVMAQAQLICEAGEKPLLMLDDLSSELDRQHLEKVLEQGIGLGTQIWLTGTELPAAVAAHQGGMALFHVEHGRVAAA